MDEDDNGREQDEDSEEENWTDVWNDLSCNFKSVVGSTNQKLPPVTAESVKNYNSQVNEITSTSKSAIETTNNSTCDFTSRPSFLRMGLNDNKAGMEGLDKEHINRVIMEASKGSKFYANQLKKEAVMQTRLNEQQRRLDQLTDTQIEEGTREADYLLADLEACRDLTRTIVHVDMDAFYAAVEMRDDPALRTKPMAVGGMSMLSTSNYLARRYGVRAAMPGFIAKKLCPNLTIVPCNFDKYIAVSKDIRGIMSKYDPNFCPKSLDEAYLDLTEHLEKRKEMPEGERTFSKRVDPLLSCSCEVLKTQDTKTTAAAGDQAEKVSDVVNAVIKRGNLHDKTLQVCNGDDKRQNFNKKIERETNQNNSFASVSGVDEDDETGANGNYKLGSTNGIDKLIETGTSQNNNFDSANGIDKVIETGRSQNNNFDSANELDRSVKLNETDMYLGDGLQHVCANCGKPKDSSVLVEKVTFGTSAEDAVNEMRFRIEAKTQLTASAGIAPNTMLAKVCSDKNKPNGQYIIASTREAVVTFINDLPLKRVCGIGKVSEQMLSALGVITCYDLYMKRGVLFHLYSTLSFHHFMQICVGIGSTTVERDGERKSISVERTFPALCRPAELYKKCYEVSEKLAEDLKEEVIMGKTVTLKLKTVKFETMTRAQSLLNPTSDLEQIYSTARDLLRAEMQNSAPEPLQLRLMGVRMSNLSKSEQTQPKQGTILGCFRKIQTKELPYLNTGEHKNQANVGMNAIRQDSLKDVSLHVSCSEVSESEQSHNNDHLPASNQAIISKQDGINPGRQGKETSSESSLGLDKAKGLLSRSSKSDGLHAHDLWCQPSEDVQKVVKETSLRQNTSIDNTRIDAQQDTARRNGNVLTGRDVTCFCQDETVTSMSRYSKQAGSSQQRQTANDTSADMFVCPVCDIPQKGCDLVAFNSHVDSCLSKRAVRELLEAEKKGQNVACSLKRSTEESNEKRSAKKRKTAVTPGSEKRHNILTYFKGGPS